MGITFFKNFLHQFLLLQKQEKNQRILTFLISKNDSLLNCLENLEEEVIVDISEDDVILSNCSSNIDNNPFLRRDTVREEKTGNKIKNHEGINTIVEHFKLELMNK